MIFGLGWDGSFLGWVFTGDWVSVVTGDWGLLVADGDVDDQVPGLISPTAGGFALWFFALIAHA